ncbi:hypothetical protein WMY93_014534 [Mugilogobius chulae]|uniref:trypsin n=1 Tax=Mugilogobius chulae TaxID=88201 RepID=A0AAW0P1D9_9GOBI
MLLLSLLLLSGLVHAHALLQTSGSNETLSSSRKVLTTTGKECKFPFRQGGQLHHHCITVLSSRPWCSLTHNFDRDRKYGFCVQERKPPEVGLHNSRRMLNPCMSGPCQNRGSCSVIGSEVFECSCPESHSGQLCEHILGRIHLRNVEQCTCVAGETRCERVHYTACRSNPCQNEGLCRLITSTGKEVCYCQRGYTGPDCSLEPRSECYSGGAGATGSGEHHAVRSPCLPWDSDLLYNELHVGNVVASELRGLGDTPTAGKTQPAANLQMFDKASSRGITTIIISIGERPKPKKAQCGKKHKKRLSAARGRIMGGVSALPGTHPWIAAIYIGHTEFCAGSLISSCWVVSAAHCFFRNPLRSQIRVVFGQHRFNVTGPNTKVFGVEEYIFPKQFSVFNPTLHDIVLIKLKKQDGRCVRKTPFIRPICLPDKGMTFPDQYCCTISGWGHISEKAESYSNLQEAGVRLIPHEFCRKPEVYGNHVTSDMLCAGLNNGCTDACQGDSGGPLACAKGDVSFLYGIISWGEGCGRTNKPGVYTKVVNYIDWINSVTGRKSNN